MVNIDQNMRLDHLNISFENISLENVLSRVVKLHGEHVSKFFDFFLIKMIHLSSNILIQSNKLI